MIVEEKLRSTDERAVRASRLSFRLLWWIPLSPIVGFTAANRLLSDLWPLWQVLPLAVILATPFAIGAYYALQAVRLGRRRAWIPLAVHFGFTVVALVMPTIESLTN